MPSEQSCSPTGHVGSSMTRSVLLEVCALSAYNVCWCGRRIAADEQNDHTLRCQATEKRETLPCHVFPARARCCCWPIPRDWQACRAQRSHRQQPTHLSVISQARRFLLTTSLGAFRLYYFTHACRRINVLKYSTGSLLLILVSVPPIRKFTLSLVYLWPSGVKEYVGPLNKFGLGLLASSLPCCRCPLFANPYNPSIPSLPPHPLFPIFPLRTEHFLGVCKDQRLLYASFSTFIYSEIKVPLIRRFRGQKMSNYNVFKISWAPDRSSPPPG